MRSTLRSLTFGLTAALVSSVSAQQPYTIVVDGVVSTCYPGQMVTIETNVGTQPYWNFQVPVDPNTCTWSAALNVATNPASFTASTPCNGMIVSSMGVAQFNFVLDSVYLSMTMDCGNSNIYDCNNVLNGPDMPGSPCDDGNPLTANDTWAPWCQCIGDSSASYDCLNIYQGPNLPGTFCVNFFGDTGVWSPDCVCMVDSGFVILDCIGLPNGPNIPGTPCVNFLGDTGVWSVDCICQTNTNTEDCLGNPGGGALPGTPCTFSPDSGNTWMTGIWSPNCVCGPDTNVFGYDCTGLWNGPAQPGTPCTVPGTVIEGTWSPDCVCEPNNPAPCEANFWVIQAMGSDSLPVPYELWVWNLSSGGSGNFTFNWNFGDGTTSSEAFPTHTYAGNGPYNLCLSIADNNGCADMYCDSISINGDGIYEGMVVHAEVRQDGFTINVQDPQANGVQEIATSGSIATWPNPAVDELNVAVVSGMKGLVNVTITDLDGRTVRNERMSLSGGRSQLRVATSDMNAGMYLLRISDGTTTLSQRFVKTN